MHVHRWTFLLNYVRQTQFVHSRATNFYVLEKVFSVLQAIQSLSNSSQDDIFTSSIQFVSYCNKLCLWFNLNNNRNNTWFLILFICVIVNCFISKDQVALSFWRDMQIHFLLAKCCLIAALSKMFCKIYNGESSMEFLEMSCLMPSIITSCLL